MWFTRDRCDVSLRLGTSSGSAECTLVELTSYRPQIRSMGEGEKTPLRWILDRDAPSGNSGWRHLFGEFWIKTLLQGQTLRLCTSIYWRNQSPEQIRKILHPLYFLIEIHIAWIRLPSWIIPARNSCNPGNSKGRIILFGKWLHDPLKFSKIITTLYIYYQHTTVAETLRS